MEKIRDSIALLKLQRKKIQKKPRQNRDQHITMHVCTKLQLIWRTPDFEAKFNPKKCMAIFFKKKKH